MLVDSHCHLDFPEFAEQLPDVIARAAANDVRVMQTICVKTTNFSPVLAIAEKYENVYCSVGVHPNNVAEQHEVTQEELEKFANHSKVIGLGETGMDYYYKKSPPDLQERSFRTHIAVARKLGLPVIVHTRDADDDTLAILKDEMKRGKFSGLIHCFSTGRRLAEGAIELGLSVSISGIVTFKNAKELQAIVKDLPLEKLLVETDAPYLAPMPHRGKTNEPSFTRHTAEFLAQLKGISYEEVAAVTTQNFFELFTKAKRP